MNTTVKSLQFAALGLILIAPLALERTTLAAIAEGDTVNVEEDWLAKLFLNARKESS